MNASDVDDTYKDGGILSASDDPHSVHFKDGSEFREDGTDSCGADDTCFDFDEKSLTIDLSETSQQETEGPHLLMLPPEILLHIFTFLEAKFLARVLSEVCVYLRQLVGNQVTWKLRMAKRWPGRRYPAVQRDDFCWQDACVEREEEWSRWGNNAQAMTAFRLADGHFSSIDAVHLMQEGRVCVSGARDRSILVCDLSRLDPSHTSPGHSTIMTSHAENCHKGWIWCISSEGEKVCTGAFDNKVKMWNIRSSGMSSSASGAQHEPLMQMNVRTPCLSLCQQDHIVVAGTYRRDVFFFDDRAGQRPIHETEHHKKPVFSLAMDDKFIISGSEDATIALYDRRHNRVINRICMPTGQYASCMSWRCGELWAGSKRGKLSVIDPASFTLIKTFSVSDAMNCNLTGVCSGAGSVVVGSTEGCVYVLDPSRPPATIARLSAPSVPHSEICSLDYQNGTLVAGSADSAVLVWKEMEEV